MDFRAPEVLGDRGWKRGLKGCRCRLGRFYDNFFKIFFIKCIWHSDFCQISTFDSMSYFFNIKYYFHSFQFKTLYQ
jgi:hypothetical protein